MRCLCDHFSSTSCGVFAEPIQCIITEIGNFYTVFEIVRIRLLHLLVAEGLCGNKQWTRPDLLTKLQAITSAATNRSIVYEDGVRILAW